MANILYKKLQQAKQEFYKSSSNMFASFNDANIDKYTSKKISVIAYWLEVLDDKIEECSQGTVIDPAPIEYLFGTDLTFVNVSGQSIERLYIRNRYHVLVPIAQLVVFPQLGTANAWSMMSTGSSNQASIGWNNFDTGITLKFLTSPYRIEVSFNNVGDMYNGQTLQVVGNGLNLVDKTVVGGVSSSDCKSLTPEEYEYYDEILNLIAIELKFNYTFTESEVTDYNNIISGDSNQTLTTESGDPLEF